MLSALEDPLDELAERSKKDRRVADNNAHFGLVSWSTRPTRSNHIGDGAGELRILRRNTIVFNGRARVFQRLTNRSDLTGKLSPG